MTAPSCALEPAETELLSRIVLDASQITYDNAQQNGELVCQLMRMLVERQAIPEHRVKYFIDPEFSGLSRGRSWQQVFERNGTSGEEIFRHPHFLQHLRYFLCGPDLPAPVIDGFSKEVARCWNVTSGDVIPLSKFARQQARARRMNPAEAYEEFYKLALDCGMSPSYAGFVKRAVQTIRYS